jgi:hypothetical protein
VRPTSPASGSRKSRPGSGVASVLESAQEAIERPRVAAAVLTALAALFLWQCWSAASHWSVTSDEVVHIPAGYVYWKTGDFSFDAEHPPLAKLIAAVPLLVSGPRLPKLDGYSWCSGYRFCFEDNVTRAVLLAPRLMISALTLLTGAVVYLWGRRLLGGAAAALAVALLLLEPNVIAHSSLVTTDAPLAAFFAATVATFWWCVQGLTWPRVAAFAAAFSAAMATKFSAILLIPILVVLAVAAALLTPEIPQRLWRRGRGPGPLPLGTVRARLAALLGIVALAEAVCYGAIWASYGFSFGAGEVADSRRAASAETIIASLRARGTAISRQPYVLCDEHRLLPHAYVAGLIDVARHNAEGHESFLLGERSVKGRPLYFVVTFLVKTPLPLLLLLAAGLALLGTGVLGRLEAAFLLVPVGIYVLVAVASNLNIGHRHLLPIVPFVALLAAVPVAAAARVQAGRRARLRAGIAVLALWCGFEAVRYRPHFLSYFNQLVGGPEQGYTALVDSNLDWGQDLYLLKQWVDENGAKDLKVSYFGPARPDADGGISCRYVTPPRLLCRPLENMTSLHDGDLLAISASYLQGLYVTPPGAFDFLRQYRPVARVGYSIFVYRIDEAHLLSP